MKTTKPLFRQRHVQQDEPATAAYAQAASRQYETRGHEAATQIGSYKRAARWARYVRSQTVVRRGNSVVNSGRRSGTLSPQ